MSIQLEQVSKSYGGRAAVVDVSVDIADGEFFVLLGPSGSGKSTLLRAIAGLSDIDHGRIVLHGRDVTNVNAREREVGFVFQNYALFKHMTVGDNIEFALRARRVRADVRRKRRQELLQLVALEGLDNRYPTQLSGGQQQRVAVARALAHEPRVLLLDEPFGALDAKIRDELRRAIRQIQRKIGITAILVTHDQEEAFSMADRIGVMDRARLQEVGEARSLYRKPATRFVATFLGAANLLLGNYDNRTIRVGESRLPMDRRALSLCKGDETTVIVRPEDIELAPRKDYLTTNPIGIGVVAEIQFVGSIERLRLTMDAGESLRSALKPAASTFLLDAARTASDAEKFPIARQQRVWVGCGDFHTLPTPISSLRLLAPTSDACEQLADAPLVRELSNHMHIDPVRHVVSSLEGLSLRGVAVVGMRSADVLDPALDLLGRGTRQVLMVSEVARSATRMLVCTDPSAAARNAALAAASSLSRHLALDVAMLVRRGDRPERADRYKELLDLRNASLKFHGLDIRTETYAGSLQDAILAREISPEQVLLVIGLASATAKSQLIRDIKAMFANSLPAGLLLVSARPESVSLDSSTATYVAAAAL